MNCLMIEIKNGQRFFTHEKNYPQLIEFSRTFDAEISVVKLTGGQVLELAELAPAICDPLYRSPTVSFEMIETKLTVEKKNRAGILKTADAIREFIEIGLMAGETISLKELRSEFAKYNLTTACFCNHMRKTLEALQKRGFRVKKVGGGKYRLVS